MPLRRRRGEILEAALHCFVEAGVAGTTIDDIRRESGASTGSLYHHFEGKEAIAEALYVEIMGTYQAAFLDTLRRHDDAEEGLKAIVAFHLEWYEGHPDEARFLLLGRPTGERAAELNELNRGFFGAVLAWMRPHVRYGAVRSLSIDLIHALLLGPADALARHWLSGASSLRPTEATDELAAAAWASIRKESK